jgi:uncharacterized protein Yka (UPF0111/DUF47 family)
VTVTTASAALNELVQTMRLVDQLYDKVRGRDPTDEEDRLISQLERRQDALERQLQAEVMERLGVDYAVLWHAVTPSGPVPKL